MDFPNPAGGCLLTDKIFGERIANLYKVYPSFGKNDVELLKLGRHFWTGKIKIIIGRNKQENEKLRKLKKPKDVLMEMKNYPGPLTLIRNYGEGEIPKKILLKAKKLTKFYSPRARNKKNIEYKIE